MTLFTALSPKMDSRGLSWASHSTMSMSPRALLQRLQQHTKFDRTVRPPCEVGMMWSRLNLLGVGASTVDRWIVEEGIPHPRKVGRPTIPR